MSLLFLPPATRDSFIGFMEQRKIQTRPLWDLNHRMPMFKDCSRAELPVAEELYERTVSIPCGCHMDDSDIERVIAAVKEFFS